jgi:spore coat polysaccharide biosynthesis protein SpsF (cytidylyltransferase family)
MKSKVLAIVQARMSSSRLPGKVLMPILGKPMLFRQIERINRSKQINMVAVATSKDSSDDLLFNRCSEEEIFCYRGSLNDVLKRFVEVVEIFNPEIVVRLTGDCPLTDPILIDELIKKFKSGDYDYISNCSPPSYPDGLDVEVMSVDCLKDANKRALLPSDREHVTLYIRQNPDLYRLYNKSSTVDLSKLRWTVDELEDFVFVNRIYQALYPKKSDFNSNDILNLLNQDKTLVTINNKFKRGEGAAKSLLADLEFINSKGLKNNVE